MRKGAAISQGGDLQVGANEGNSEEEFRTADWHMLSAIVKGLGKVCHCIHQGELCVTCYKIIREVVRLGVARASRRRLYPL
jgi:hypothetical protein